MNKRLEAIDRTASHVSCNSTSLTNYMNPYGMNDIFYKAYFSDYIYQRFESGEFRIPRDYDSRLRSLYRNYMELPPEDKRIIHVTKAYWVKNS